MALTREDREALRRCMELIERADPGITRLLERRAAAGESWEKRALFACAFLQSRAMRLKPWEIAPCNSAAHSTDAMNAEFAERKRRARHLANRLRAVGLSVYEPDPIEALHARAEQRPHAIEAEAEPPPAA
jgi:hypothetical protein